MIAQTIGSIGVLLTADASNLENVFNASSKVISNFKRMIVAGLGFVGVGLSIREVYRGIVGAMEEGSAAFQRSVIGGVGTKDLVIFEQALKNTGASAGMASRTLSYYERSMSTLLKTTSGKDMASMLGLGKKESMASFRKLPLLEQIQTIGKAIQTLESGKQQEVISRLFGRGAYRMKGFFDDPAKAIATATKGLGGLPKLMEDNGAAWNSMLDSMSMTKRRMQGVFMGIAEGVLPVIDNIVAYFEKIDWSFIGKKIGRSIAIAFEIVRSGRLMDFFIMLWDYVSLTFKEMWTNLISWLKDEWVLVAMFLEKKIKSAIRPGKAAEYEEQYKRNVDDFQTLRAAEIMIKAFRSVEEGPTAAEQAKQKLIDFMSAMGETVDDQIMAIQDEAKPKPKAGKETEEGMVRQFAQAAVYGTAEAYRAELGINKANQMTADNTGRMADIMDEFLEGQDRTNRLLEEGGAEERGI